MPVISLSGDVGAESQLPSLLRAQDKPFESDKPAQDETGQAEKPLQKGKQTAGRAGMHASSSSMDLGRSSRSRTKTSPTPISPVLESPPTMSGPNSASSSRPIPPPPTPRRHKSGILMSRVRAHTSGSTFKSSSKSFGDLSESALGMSHMGEIGGSSSAGTSPSKRIVSEGARDLRDDDDEDDDDMWDNR